MKRELLVFIIVLLCVQVADAQNMFNKGDKKLNLGVGIGSTLYTGTYYTNRIPPISASFEVGVKDELFDEKSSLGVGGYIGYTGARWEEMGYGWKYSSIIIGGRGTLHYQLIENVDTYTGIMLGYNIVSSSSFGDSVWDDYSSVGSSTSYSWYIGARYSFNESFAAMAELGYGVAYLNLGITLSF